MKEHSCDKALITVIVPVYQAKRTLPDCLESLLEQTYPNLEILLVDDGSADGSAEWIEAFIAAQTQKAAQGNGEEGKKKDVCLPHRSIRLLRKENGGVSSARNLGLAEARGDYIAFADADDWLLPGLLSWQLSCLKSQDADMAISGYREVGETERQEERQKRRERREAALERREASREQETSQTGCAAADGPRLWPKAGEEAEACAVRTLDGKAYAETYLLRGNTRCWSVLYRRELIGGTRFMEGLAIGEDLLFLTKLLPRLRRVCILPEQGYCYYQNEGGAMFSGFRPSYMDQIRCWQLARPELERISEQCAIRADVCLFQGALLAAGKLALLCAAARSGQEFGAYLEQCVDAARAARERLKTAGAEGLLPVGYRIKGALFLRAPRLYLSLYHIWKAGFGGTLRHGRKIGKCAR